MASVSVPASAQEMELKHDSEYAIDGKIYGLPEAKIYREDYNGPAVVGDYLTQVPNLAKLDYSGNKTHNVRMDVFSQKIEVAPGVSYSAWTFGGSVPGPVLHVREGDRVIFKMKNRSDEEVTITKPVKNGSPFFQQVQANGYQNNQPVVNPMPHSMDFHSGTVAAEDKWRTISPGETIEFEWIANYAGTYMYHCGTSSVLMHTAMGQYGVVVVSPKDGYQTDKDVDKEFVLVQSEHYLEEASEGNYIYNHGAALDRQPSHVTFNGHVAALSDNPLRANEGDPRNEWYGMQTVLLGASNSATIEFIVPEEGIYKLVDHEFADAERGAAGALIAGPRKEK